MHCIAQPVEAEQAKSKHSNNRRRAKNMYQAIEDKALEEVVNVEMKSNFFFSVTFLKSIHSGNTASG